MLHFFTLLSFIFRSSLLFFVLSPSFLSYIFSGLLACVRRAFRTQYAGMALHCRVFLLHLMRIVPVVVCDHTHSFCF